MGAGGTGILNHLIGPSKKWFSIASIARGVCILVTFAVLVISCAGFVASMSRFWADLWVPLRVTELSLSQQRLFNGFLLIVDRFLSILYWVAMALLDIYNLPWWISLPLCVLIGYTAQFVVTRGSQDTAHAATIANNDSDSD
ncbi:MAG: hypothetical protein WC763_05365 [Candidatus Paceibacterota bacterium]|jgi:hypothetical protein